MNTIHIEGTFTPSADRVLVRVHQHTEQTASGIYIPEAARSGVTLATIVAVGPGIYRNGHWVPTTAKEGQTCLVPDPGGTDMVINGEPFKVYAESNILGFIEG